MNILPLTKIDSELKVYKNKKVIIWGAGSAGRKLYRLLRICGIESVVAFCDKNAGAMNGEEVMGLPVVSPDELNRIYTEEYVIQIASTWEKEIEAELLKRGINNYITYSEAEIRLENLRVYSFSKANPKLYKHYLKNYYNNLIVPDGWEQVIQSSWESDDCIVCLCMPPKTGDHTIMYTLDKYGISYINFWHTAEKFSDEIKELLGNRPLKVITGIRDTISQNLSLMFEELDYQFQDWDEYWESGCGNANTLFAKYIKNLMEWENKERETLDCFQRYLDKNPCTRSMQNFYHKEYSHFFGVNLYNYSFDKEKGFEIIKEGNVEIFVYQLEKLNAIKDALFDFLNIAKGELVIGRSAEEKYYNPYYKDALKHIEFSREYYEACYQSQEIHHFYSDEDLQKFEDRWKSHIID